MSDQHLVLQPEASHGFVTFAIRSREGEDTHASVRPGQLGEGIVGMWSLAAAVQVAHS